MKRSKVLVQESDFDVAEEIRWLRHGLPEIGAVATFIGTVRDINENSKVSAMTLEHYPGTLIFVSHDRQFVSSLATRIIELSANGVTDYHGSYEDYLRSIGVV